MTVVRFLIVKFDPLNSSDTHFIQSAYSWRYALFVRTSQSVTRSPQRGIRNSRPPFHFPRIIASQLQNSPSSSAFPLPNSHPLALDANATSQKEKQGLFPELWPTGCTWRWCRLDVAPARCLCRGAQGTRRVPGRNAAHGLFSDCLES